jgi:putative serine protease PepD
MTQVVAVAVFVALLAGLLGGALGYVVAARTVGPAVSLGDSAAGTPALAKRPPGSIAGIARRIQPAVVTIDIRSATSSGNGSGFIISKDGYILTNNHVAEPGDRGGSLTVVFHDGSTLPARIIGRDPGSDVAVLKVAKNDLPAVEFADSDKASVGDPVIAFGSPLGLNGTVTTGIISALERPVKTGGREGGEEAYMAAIQTDAAINPGNSGGPLVDGDGRVLGVDSAIATIPGETGKAGSIGLGFAIPMNQAKRTAEQLIANGKATTTVIGADLDRDTKLPNGGVRVTSVPDGPAKAAGLRAGDVIIRLNNRVIGDAVDLIALVRKLPPGARANIVFLRAGRATTTTITLGAKTVN